MKKRLDLSKYSFAELSDLQNRIEAAMATAKNVARKDALREIRETAAKHGFSLKELLDGEATQSRSKTKTIPKYRNPGDASQTWSGRGRQPEWFKSALAAGFSKESMLV